MSAEAIAKALGGRKAGGAWTARCPAHDDRKPSLSLADGDDGKLLVHCHAGCEQAQLIAVLRSRGLWQSSHPRWFARLSIRGSNRSPFPKDRECGEAALRIWNATCPANGTLVENYLSARGIHGSVPDSVRFHDRLKHRSGGFWPAMVSLVTDGGNGIPLGIHRTFLARDGNGKAPVEAAKMMLGPCRGGVVQLGQPNDVLMVGEGIETTLSAMQATGQVAWAALSTSGLRRLELPVGIRDVVVLADGDEPGEVAAQDCAWRWNREGRRVRIARPPRGMDFNDILQKHSPNISEGDDCA